MLVVFTVIGSPAHNWCVDVEVRYIQGCPSVTVTRERLALALDAVGHPDTDVRLRLVRSVEEAQELGFVGSPTVLVDGTDLFATTEAAIGLSCRLYRDGAAVSGSPSVEQLTDALGGAAANWLGTQRDRWVITAQSDRALRDRSWSGDRSGFQLHGPDHPPLRGRDRLRTNRQLPINYAGCGAGASAQFGVVGSPLNRSASHCMERSPSMK